MTKLGTVGSLAHEDDLRVASGMDDPDALPPGAGDDPAARCRAGTHHGYFRREQKRAKKAALISGADGSVVAGVAG